MKFIKFAIFLLLIGCAVPTKFARYTELSRGLLSFESEKNTLHNELDSTEISLRYMVKDSLDAYFYALSTTGAGETIMGVEPRKGIASNQNDAISKFQQRVIAMKRVLLDQNLVTAAELDSLEAHLFKLDCAAGVYYQGYYNFATVPYYWTSTERAENPYNIQEYQSGKRVGSATTWNNPWYSTTIFSSQDQPRLTNEMGLEVFEITIKNQSVQKQFIDPQDIWLVDDLGNQQRCLGLDFFETLYIKSAEKDQQPLQFANIQRTLLTNAPLFPGQTRKAFLAFYPISTSAKSFKIYWSPSNEQNQTLDWTFSPKYDIEKKKFLNVGIGVIGYFNRNRIIIDRQALRNCLIFIKPIQVLGVSNGSGILSALVDIEHIDDQLTLYAIASGDARPGEQTLRVFYGTKTITIDNQPKKPGPEFVEINLEGFVVNLGE